MSRNTAASSSAAAGAHPGMRQRIDIPPTLSPIQSLDSPPPRQRKRALKKDVKGKKRAFGWGMGVQSEWVEDSFKRFGEHCARNQIRTLLIDCLVMTNLFYPSMAIYLSKRYPPPSADSPFAQPHAGPSRISAQKEHPLGILTTRLLDSFFPYPPPLLPRLRWTGWWDDTPATEDDAGIWGLERPGDESMEWLKEEVRVMRIAWTDVKGVVDGLSEERGRTWTGRDQAILDQLRDIAEAWESGDGIDTGHKCVRGLPRGGEAPDVYLGRERCLIFSPYGMNATGVQPIRMPNERYRRDHDIYQGVAMPFHVSRGTELDFERRWARQMAVLSERLQGEAFEEARAPGRSTDINGSWLLSFRSASSPAPTPLDNEPTLSPSPSKLVYLLYLALFSALGHQLSNASKVHSRFGLAFTGCVQLCCSSVMSFSILALLGWNGWGVSMEPTTLPTYILPFVITVVGVENMSTLTRAVFSVPFTYSVPARIGLALSKVGTSITVTSLADLLVLGIVWFVVNMRPVREFCVFAAVLIVTDWFMLHTFFLTILSIDAQRLELADVLASSDGSVKPATTAQTSQAGEKQNIRNSWVQIIRGRIAKSGSLIAILCCVGIIYYLTERHRLPPTAATLYGYDPTAPVTTLSRPTPTPHVPAANVTSPVTEAESIWRVINPVNWPSVLISLPPASILVLPQADHVMAPSALRALAGNQPRSPWPRIKPLLHAIKVLILPQAVTALALYSLLLYLLKDKQLLDAQRDKLGRGEASERQAASGAKQGRLLADRTKVRMLPCTAASDVEILSTSADGQMVLSVSLDDTVHLWRFDEGANTGGSREKLDTGQGLNDDCLVAAAISVDHIWIALAFRGGKVQIWHAAPESPTKLHETRQVDVQGRVMDVAFQTAAESGEDPFTARKATITTFTVPAVLVIATKGSVTRLDPSGEQHTVRTVGNDQGRAYFIEDFYPHRTRLLVEDPFGASLWTERSSSWEARRLNRSEQCGRITAVSSYALNRGDYGGVIALGSASGLVEVCSASGDLMIALRHPEAINTVSVIALPSSTCTTCFAELPTGFFIAAGTANQTHLDLVHPRGSATTCRCVTANSVRRTPSTDNMQAYGQVAPTARTRSRSLVIPPSPARKITPGSSPMRSPSLLPPVSNGEFPLSSHGTRRYSNLHRDDMERVGSASEAAWWADLESTSLGAISTAGGGSVIAGDRILALHRAGTDVGDSSWLILSVDLAACWNGSTLVVESTNLAAAARKTATEQVMAESSMRARRTERLLSLGGRVSFPSLGGKGSLSGSIASAGEAGLAYVSVRPIASLGRSGLVAGFGNRLGVISLDMEKNSADQAKSPVRNGGHPASGASGGRKVSPITAGGSLAMSTGTTFLAPPPTTVSSSKKVS